MLSVYVNGEERVHAACAGDPVNSSNVGMVLGRIYVNSNGNYFGGHMDGIRVTRGGALWMDNFDPSAENPPALWP